jgi:hypothetical protein
MADVNNTLNLRLSKHKVKKSWLIKLGHLLKGKIPKAYIECWVQVFVVFAESVAP